MLPYSYRRCKSFAVRHKILFGVIVGILLYFWWFTSHKQTKQFIDSTFFKTFFDLPFKSSRNNTINILLWTKYFNLYSGWKDFHGPFDAKCPWHCEISWERNLLPESDVVVFNVRDLGFYENDLPRRRWPNQIWLLHNTEPPWWTWLDIRRFNNVFNWTSFVRRDSEVILYYSKFIPREHHESVTQMPDFHGQKWKFSAWMASNCMSRNKREDYVKVLQHYIPVDTYGHCGTLDIGCRRGKVDCDTLRPYKFYFAFENANCRDYVTEKLWRTLELGVLPVVMGGNGNYETLAPPGSYINSADFASPKQLAQYLKLVSENKTLYNSYFKWRQKYSIVNTYWCDLCGSLHKWKGPRQVYKDLEGWFQQDTCVQWNVIDKAADIMTFIHRIVLNILNIR